MKNIAKFMLIVVAAIMLFCDGVLPPTAAYFFSVSVRSGEVSAGSVQVAIEGLQVGHNIVAASQPIEGFGDATIRLNSSLPFSFRLRNTGRSAIDCTISMELAWQEELSESTKLSVFPAHLTDEQIIERLDRGDYSDAVMGGGEDTLPVLAFDRELEGMAASIDQQELSGSASGGESALDYSFKLFFYGDEQVYWDIESFDNQLFELAISAYATLAGSSSAWEDTDHQFFRVETQIDSIEPPVISLVGGLPTTFFVSQHAQIELADYARATDSSEGDISDRVQFVAPTLLTAGVAGEHIVTYYVKNSLGIAGEPLQVTIVLWDFVKVVAGSYHALALTSHGRVYAWGQNTSGQLGDGTGNHRSLPALVAGLEGIVDIAACKSSSYALSGEGRVYAWGHNGYGHLGDGTTSTRKTPVEVALPSGVRLRSISAGYNTAGGIAENGDVYTWGYGGYGVLGDGVSNEINPLPKKIAVENAAYLELGDNQGAVLTAEGRLYVFGSNIYGQLGLGAADSAKIYEPTLMRFFEATPLAQLSVGDMHMAAVSAEGDFYAWGNGYRGCLASGNSQSFSLPKRADFGGKAIAKTFVGSSSRAVLTVGGSVYLFGADYGGKLGQGGDDIVYAPVEITGLFWARAVAFSADATLILTGDSLYGLGDGAYGILASGNDSDTAELVEWAFVPPPPS